METFVDNCYHRQTSLCIFIPEFDIDEVQKMYEAFLLRRRGIRANNISYPVSNPWKRDLLDNLYISVQ